MDLAVWLPALFVLGVASILACLAFTEGCARWDPLESTCRHASLSIL